MGRPGATDFEFKNRFWVICAVFVLGFGMDRVDPVRAAAAIAAGLLKAGLPWTWDAALSSALWFAALLTLAGAAIRTWGSAYLGREVVGDSAVRTEALVADGPYRWVRNPLYLGLILVGAGIGLAASRIGWFIIVVGIAAVAYRLIQREEADLLHARGEPYRAFLAAVPRLLPALAPRVPARGSTARWPQAFAGEILMWGLGFAVVSLAVTRDQRVFQWALVAAFVVYAVALVALRRSVSKPGGS